MLMFPTSLPGGNPGGIVAARPTSPAAASAVSVGIAATSRGVRPPSSSTGSSLAPSGTHTTYFIVRALQPELGTDGVVLGVDRGGNGDLGDGTVGVLQAVSGQDADHGGALGCAHLQQPGDRGG